MKNKQKTIFISFPWFILGLVLSLSTAFGKDHNTLIRKGDSLYTQKQYTQSFKLYKEIFDQNFSSESMLLKMAFIQEGLENKGQSLYYLLLYYLQSGDKEAVRKIKEVAIKNNLQGYQKDVVMQLNYILKRYAKVLVSTVLSIGILLFAVLLYRKKKLKKRAYGIAILIGLLMGGLFFFLNGSQKVNTAIITTHHAYIMSGPSSGASVITIANEGHLVTVLEEHGIWLRIMWMNSPAYIKKRQVSTLRRVLVI